MASLYATVDQFYQTGIPATALSNVQPSQITAALTNASSLIDSYFQSTFVLPLTLWDFSVTQACIDIAAWLVMKSEGFAPSSGSDEAITAGYKAAMSWLRDVSQKRARPVCTDSSPNNRPLSPVMLPVASQWSYVLG